MKCQSFFCKHILPHNNDLKTNTLRKYRTISSHKTQQTLPYKHYYLLKVIPIQTDLSFPVLNEENQQEGTEAALTLSYFIIGMSFHPSGIQLSTHPDRGMYSSVVNSAAFQQGDNCTCLYHMGKLSIGWEIEDRKRFWKKSFIAFSLSVHSSCFGNNAPKILPARKQQ